MTKQRPDYSRAAGGAALGARLRRLSERLDRDATRIYAQQGIRFEQRWFGVLNQLVVHGSLSIGELAQALNITHVSVSQTSRSLATAGIVSSVTARADARRRSLRLTAKGAALVPAAFDNLAFEFHGRTLSGQQQPRARWKRATGALDRALGEAVGQIYVQRHFTSAARAQITALVENLRAAFRTRIARSTWMSNETRQAAQQKLAMLRVKVGYPDTWRSYASLEVRAGDPVGNRKRALAWDWHRKVARLGAPTDRTEWGMTPQTVNAYYESSFNEIVFPAAILQPPYFDPGADPAVNYGGIGGVIGHEMGHAFEDQGSKSDGNGVLRTWWKNQDVARFKALVAGLVVQYARYEPLPGVHLDGATTLGENIGDNAGLRIALEAYRISLHGQDPPVLDGFSGEQRFFLSWAQTYRENVRGEQLRRDIASDPHSPAEFRVNGVVRNMDAWYAAFGVKPGAKLYLAPKERIQIW